MHVATYQMTSDSYQGSKIIKTYEVIDTFRRMDQEIVMPQLQ